jgi:hypothetical protein
MSNKNCSNQKDEPFNLFTSNEVRPNPKSDINISKKSTPFEFRQWKLFSALSLRWGEFFLWLSAAFIAGFICGGFIIATIYRICGW